MGGERSGRRWRGGLPCHGKRGDRGARDLRGRLGDAHSAEGPDNTWTGSAGDSNLDHVVASTGLSFKALGSRTDGSPAEILVKGWQQLSGAARKAFVAEVSDHCALYAEVQ